MGFLTMADLRPAGGAGYVLIRITVDAHGRVFVVDAGNKRGRVRRGGLLTQFGGGVGQGQFDEPVGIALDGDGNVYVTVQNQRAGFAPDGGLVIHRFPSGGQRLVWWVGENRPFIAVGASGTSTSPTGGLRAGVHSERANRLFGGLAVLTSTALACRLAGCGFRWWRVGQ